MAPPHMVQGILLGCEIGVLEAWGRGVILHAVISFIFTQTLLSGVRTYVHTDHEGFCAHGKGEV